MKAVASGKMVVCAVAAMLSLSACGQPNSDTNPASTDPTPGATQVAAEQKDWKSITASADTALKSGNKADAEAKYKEAITVAEALGEKDPGNAEAVANLANFYYVQGDAEQANLLYQRSLKLREKALGLEHVDLVKDLEGLGKVSKSQKKLKEASAYYKRAIGILKKNKQPIPDQLKKDYDEVLHPGPKKA